MPRTLSGKARAVQVKSAVSSVIMSSAWSTLNGGLSWVKRFGPWFSSTSILMGYSLVVREGLLSQPPSLSLVVSLKGIDRIGEDRTGHPHIDLLIAELVNGQEEVIL